MQQPIHPPKFTVRLIVGQRIHNRLAPYKVQPFLESMRPALKDRLPGEYDLIFSYQIVHRHPPTIECIANDGIVHTALAAWMTRELKLYLGHQLLFGCNVVPTRNIMLRPL